MMLLFIASRRSWQMPKAPLCPTTHQLTPSQNTKSFCKMPLRTFRNAHRFGGENLRRENNVLQHAGRI